MLKFKFNFNYCKSILKFLIYCYGQKLLLFNYNIQNNLTTTTIMIEREAEAETYSRRGLQMETSRKPSRWGSVSCTRLEIDGGCWWGVVEEVVGVVVVVVWWWWSSSCGGRGRGADGGAAVVRRYP